MAKAPLDVRSLARQHTAAAIASLAGIATNGKSESARVAAATALLDRGWGRAQAAEGDGEQVTIVIRRILEGPGTVEASQPSPGAPPALEGEVLPRGQMRPERRGRVARDL
jgi:hypothetical protein